MERRTKIRCLIALATLILMLPLMIIPSSAFTIANTYWPGSYSYGAEIRSEDRIVIESQTVTIDASEFPAYDDEEGIKAYNGTAKTEYSLYNPTDKEITITLSFSLAEAINYPVDTEIPDVGRYSIMLDGKELQLDLRYGVNHQWDDKPIDGIETMVYDEYKSDEYISQETTVTKYSYRQSGVKDEYAYVGFDLFKNHILDSCIYFGEYGYKVDWNTGKLRLTSPAAENGEEIEFYVFGDDLDTIPVLSAYDRIDPDNDARIDGEFEFIGKEMMTFSEFVFGYYDEACGVGEVDFYNMAAAEMSSAIENRVILSELRGLTRAFIDYRVAGYVYRITLAPGQRAVHSITIPTYPSVETRFEPPTYTYIYDIPYGNAIILANRIDVNINTKYYLIEGDGFEKNEKGYSRTIDLNNVFTDNTDDEGVYGIRLTLCEAENPEESDSGLSSDFGALIILIIIIIVPVIIIGGLFDLFGDGINYVIELFEGESI